VGHLAELSFVSAKDRNGISELLKFVANEQGDYLDGCTSALMP
jgi:hypothetical protein